MNSFDLLLCKECHTFNHSYQDVRMLQGLCLSANVLIQYALLDFIKEWVKITHESTVLTDRISALKDHASIWEDAPFLKGSTRFEPQSDINNIMITGGAGFM